MRPATNRTDADATPIQDERVYLPFLDGVRALAALFVVFHHLWQYGVLSGPVPPPWFQAFSVLKYGTYGVAVFLVISGYCLMLPIARQPVARLPRGFGPFARRRGLRLLPAYFLVLITSILLIIAVPSLRTASGTPWDITLPNLRFDSVTSHVFLVHNWVEAWRWSINPPLWSIALELQVYAVFALGLLPLVRTIGVRFAAAVAFIVSLALTATGFGFMHPWMLGLFALGVAAAHVTAGGRQRSSHDTTLLLVGGAAVVVATLAAEPIRSEVLANMIGEVVVGCATATMVVVLASREQGSRSASRSLARALSWRPLRALGRASYSLYLVHYPIVAVIYLTVVRDRGWGVPMSCLTLAVLAAPVIAAATAAVFFAAERPFLRRPAPRSCGIIGDQAGQLPEPRRS